MLPCGAAELPHALTELPHELTKLPHELTELPHELTKLPHELTKLPHELTELPHLPVFVSRRWSGQEKGVSDNDIIGDVSGTTRYVQCNQCRPSNRRSTP